MAFEWVKLELEFSKFDPARWAPVADELRATGLVFTTLAMLGATTANQRKLYELNKSCSADIPDRGPFHSWDDYYRLRLLAPGHDPSHVVVALDDGEWVGMSEVSFQPHRDFAFKEMTGVLRSHRRRGLAAAMKVIGLNAIATTSARTIRTVNHPDNTAMIHLNRRLGYRDAFWNFPLDDDQVAGSSGT